MQFSEYRKHDAVALADLVRKKDVKPAELLDVALARAADVNPKLNAIVIPHEDIARTAVKAGPPPGPFMGVPFLLKDLNAYLKGTITTGGSRFFKDYVAPYTSTLVERYQRAGLVIFGKTASPEFGATPATEPLLFGPCRNPWNMEHTPGGSSGGASAAVAAGIVPAAHASDGGGSIRIPASCTGLVGLKPSRGRTPAGPRRGEGWAGLSIAHVVSRTVRDSAALLDATDAPSPGDPYAAPHKERPYVQELTVKPGRLHIGFSVTAMNGAPVDLECADAVRAAAKLLESLGHEVEERAPAIDIQAMGDAQRVIVQVSTATVLRERAAELGRPYREDEVELVNRIMADAGMKTLGPDYLAAINTVHRGGRDMGAFFETADIYLTPVMACLPLPVNRLSLSREDIGGWMADLQQAVAFTTLANQTGCPSISLPLAMSNSGLPIGVMATAKLGGEGTLFRLAAQLEEAAPWKDRVAPL